MAWLAWSAAVVNGGDPLAVYLSGGAGRAWVRGR